MNFGTKTEMTERVKKDKGKYKINELIQEQKQKC